MTAALLAKDCGEALTSVAQGIYFSGIPLSTAIDAFEKRLIEAALEECAGNKCAAARKLGMHRNTLERHISALKIQYWKFNRPGTRRVLRAQQIRASSGGPPPVF